MVIMKKNKILISEISRIQSLMTGNLILESWVSVVDDILKYAGKFTGKLSVDTEKLLAKLSKAATEDETVKILADIANSSDEMAEIILPKVMATIDPKASKAIADFKSLLKDSINQGLDPEIAKASAEDWVKKNVQTNFNGVKKIIEKDLFDYVDNISKKTSPNPIPKPKIKPKTITDVAGQSWENVEPLSIDELKKLEKTYRQKGLGKSFFRAMRQFAQNVTGMMTSQYELMDETLSLIKSFDTVQNAAQKYDIAKKIGDNIQLLTNKDKANYQIIDEWIDSNVLDYKLKSKLKGIDGYTKAAKIFDGAALKAWKENYKTFSKRRLSLLKQVNSMINPASWFGGAIKKWPGDSWGYKVFNKWKSFIKGPEFSELRNYILTGQTQKWSGIKKFKEEFGFIPAIGNVTKELVYNYVILSLLYGVLDYITDIFGNIVRDVPYINEWGVIQNQIDSYDAHIKNDEHDGVKAIKGWQHFIGDIGDYSFEELKDMRVAFPGLIDDFGILWDSLRTKKIDKEEAQKISEEAEKLKRNVKNEMEKIQKKGSQVVETYSSKKFFEQFPCYQNVLDTNYNENGYVSGVKLLSPNKISIRVKETNESYVANLNIADRGWYFEDGTKLKC
jgi:hypothetical protein